MILDNLAVGEPPLDKPDMLKSVRLLVGIANSKDISVKRQQKSLYIYLLITSPEHPGADSGFGRMNTLFNEPPFDQKIGKARGCVL